MDETAEQRKTRFRGLHRVGWTFTFAAAAYICPMRNLSEFTPPSPGRSVPERQTQAGFARLFPHLTPHLPVKRGGASIEGKRD